MAGQRRTLLGVAGEEIRKSQAELLRISQVIENLLDRLSRLEKVYNQLIRQDSGAMSATPVRIRPLPALGTFRFELNYDDSALVHLDDGPKIRLTPASASVFKLLALSGEPPLTWKAAARLRHMLSQIEGTDVSEHALENRVHVLRKRFVIAGYRRDVIEFHKRYGYRILLQEGREATRLGHHLNSSGPPEPGAAELRPRSPAR